MTEKDRNEFKAILKEAIDSLKELLIEKLNGHGESVERHSKEIDHLYELDRKRVDEIAALKAGVVRVEGKVDALDKVGRLEEDARDKRETAVEAVQDKATAKGQFSATAWVSIALALLSAGIAIWAVLK